MSKPAEYQKRAAPPGRRGSSNARRAPPPPAPVDPVHGAARIEKPSPEVMAAIKADAEDYLKGAAKEGLAEALREVAEAALREASAASGASADAERAAAAERAAERRRDNEGRGDENRARRPGRPSGGGPEAGGVRRVPDAPSRSGRGVYEDSAVKARSRRLFGGLLGHLGSAKKKLEADADVLAKRRSQQDFAASKAHRLKREALAAAKHACKEVKYKELAARDEILTNLRKTEAALLHADFAAKCDLLKAFLRTEAEPKIFWLPKRHTDATRAKLAATARGLDGDVAAKAEAYEAFAAEHDKAFATRRERREKAAEHATAKFTNVPGAPPRAASPSRRDAPRRRESDEARRDEERRDEGRRESGDDRPPLDVEDELAAIDDMDDERDREPEPEILS